MIELALYEPDIAPNAGAVIRLGACLGLRVRIIEPAGFVWPSAQLRRAAMDYLAQADVVRDASFQAFREATAGRRLVLMTTRGATPYLSFRFQPGDILMMGRESAGVPDAVHALADARLVIPMREGLRSLNVGMACAMAVGEALRQLAGGARRTK
jgi:tRNA (cytidine/uridine-2'-O-)-methyltransferase